MGGVSLERRGWSVLGGGQEVWVCGKLQVEDGMISVRGSPPEGLFYGSFQYSCKWRSAGS